MPDINSFGTPYVSDMFQKALLRRLTRTGLILCWGMSLHAQDLLLGADLSYVNEMEDCGVIYQEGNEAKDLYSILADHGCALARYRLWHNPSWYDQLNQGKRYSDLPDVMKSIRRAKEHGMQVLLDFQLSDFWADPSRQWAPEAWAGIVGNLPVLEDSLYNYIRETLLQLDASGLLPEMVQIGNETNRDILMATGVNAPWQLDWSRNAPLFNTAIRAVREISAETGEEIRIALHIAGPQNVEWYMDGFISHGVTDFDIIGLSYYWPYHKPVTIAETGQVISRLRQHYSNKEVMILETGCIWTTSSHDQAVNVLNEIAPGYTPSSPEEQARWMIDLTREVYRQGGTGVIYWEPDWVSSGCRTYWAQGSHYENAAFFDFDNNLLVDGGINFFEYDYTSSSARVREDTPNGFRIVFQQRQCRFLSGELPFDADYSYRLVDPLGRILRSGSLNSLNGTSYEKTVSLPGVVPGWVTCILLHRQQVIATNLHWIGL